MEIRTAEVLGLPQVSGIAFQELTRRYLGSLEGKQSASTVRDKRNRVGQLLKVWPNHSASAITAEQVRLWTDRQFRRGLSSASVNRMLSLLSAMMRWGVERGYLASNPVAEIRRGREASRAFPYPSPADQEKILARMPEEIQPAVRLARDAGLRAGEIDRLTVGDIDLGANEIVVRVSKSGHYRRMPLLAQLRKRLVPLLGGRSLSEKLLNFRLPSGMFYRKWDEGCARAGVAGLRFHDLRHWCASNLLRAGVSLPDVREFLGHRSLAATLRYIDHVSAGAKQRVQRQLENYLAPRKWADRGEKGAEHEGEGGVGPDSARGRMRPGRSERLEKQN